MEISPTGETHARNLANSLDLDDTSYGVRHDTLVDRQIHAEDMAHQFQKFAVYLDGIAASPIINPGHAQDLQEMQDAVFELANYYEAVAEALEEQIDTLREEKPE